MKKTYKIIVFLVSVSLIFSLLSLSVSASDKAADASTGIGTTIGAEAIAEVEATESADTNAGTDTNAGADTPTDSDTSASTDDITKPDSGETVFDTVYAILLENSDKIFSLLSFLISAVIAFLYKKSLMPTIKGTVTGISGALTKLREENTKDVGVAIEAITKTTERLFETEQTLATLRDELFRIESELDTKKIDDEDRRAIRAVLSSEVDMLYEIFMQSSLPQYQKDKVGERIAGMKATLGSGETKND